jgi:type VI secretion system protein ImpK
LGNKEVAEMTNDIDMAQDTLVAGLDGGSVKGRLLTDGAERPSAGLLSNMTASVANNAGADSYSASINPLVAAASSLLSQVVAITITGEISDLVAMKEKLTLEIGGFKTRALALGAEHSSLDEASYVLCTLVDEAVMQTKTGQDGKWAKTSLLNEQHGGTTGGKGFFDILERLKANPVKHLDMLELMYLCLALGFQGKHGVKAHEKGELADIRDGLYRLIRHLRGDVPRELSPHWHGLTDKRRNLVRIVPWWLVVLFTLMCLAVMYSGFAWVLSEQRETVLEPYRQLDPAVIQSPSQGRDA